MNARAIAHIIIQARKALARGFIQREVMESPEAAAAAQAEFVWLVRSLPISVRASGQMLTRFDHPTRRRIERAGILAAAEWAGV